MSNKIQGEGDYEAARRFNKDEQDFVKRKYGKKHGPAKGDPYAAQQSDTAEEGLDAGAKDDDSEDDVDSDFDNDLDAEGESLGQDVPKPGRNPGIEFPNRR